MLYRNWLQHSNFSDRDDDAVASVRYQYPEHLSATASHLAAERRLIAEHARGLKRTIPVAEGHELLGVKRDGDRTPVTAHAPGEGGVEASPSS
jgi:hypothetical protein